MDYNTDLETLLKKIETRTMQIESKLASISNRPIEYHITVQQVDIHHPILKELTFSLDSLDIKELSGALNIGNNFGSKLGNNQNQKKQTSDKPHLQQKPKINSKEPSSQNQSSKKSSITKTDDTRDSSIDIKINNKNLSFSIDNNKIEPGGE